MESEERGKRGRGSPVVVREMVRQRKRETGRKEMKSVMTMRGTCGKRK